MLLNIKKYRTKLYTIGIIALSCIAINACSTDVSYISREEFKKASFAQDKPLYLEKKPLSLGAFRLTDKNAAEGSPGHVFSLQRQRSVYMTETKIMDTGKKRYFLSVGIDYKTKTPAMGFRMEF